MRKKSYEKLKMNPIRYAKFLEQHRIWNRKWYARMSSEKRKERFLYSRNYRQENREKLNLKKREYCIKLRDEVLKHYGNKCTCCGESHKEFLSIDHISGKGNQHRKEHKLIGSYKIYFWLRKQHFPTGFRILCHNCNQSLGHYGYCPHSKSSSFSLKHIP